MIHLYFLEKEKIVPIARCHPYYPKDLQKKPLCFYAKGNVRLLQTDKFVVVGSRNTSTFVSLLTKSVAKDLSNVFTVLTGVAEGGDLSAVEGALNGSKKVICLLPSGFSAVPKQNLSILERAEKDGLLLTCRPYETTVYPYFYEERNECLADLSKGGLIVSAGEKSGALITAKYLFKTGKPVFAFPYEIGSKYGTGCNKLIQSGAYLTETANDVLTKLGMAPTADVKKPSSYSATEQAVLSALQTESELGIEQLTLLPSLPTPTLIGVLTSLEMKEAILRVGGNKYKLTP